MSSLSQDEINALLNNMDNDNKEDKDDVKGSELSDFLSPIEEDALGEIGNITFGSASTALSTLLNQKVDITTPTVHLLLRDNLKDEFPEPHVSIHVDYTVGFRGINLLVIKETDAKIIASLMMGGDGSYNDEEELSELHLSAVQEAMNQMMGSAATSMSTVFNKMVDISPPGINVLDVKNPDSQKLISDEEVLIKVAFDMKIGNLIDSSIMQLLPVKFAKELVEQLMNPEPTPEPEKVVEQPKQTQQPTTQPSQSPQPSHNGGNMANSNNLHSQATDVQSVQFSSFDSQPSAVQSDNRNLDMLMDIPLNVTVELGRTQRSVQDIIGLSQGSIIELDKLAGEPVDILVNNKIIAKGEVVVIDENFGVRVTDILSPADRINKLK